MGRIAFKVDGNAKKIVACLNHFTKDTELLPMTGDAHTYSYYYIDYNPGTYKITNYNCEDSPSNVDFYKEIIPTFMQLPLDIQIEIVNRSRCKSFIPFLNDVCLSESGGGFDWSNTPEGWEFWNKVLNNGDTDLFYKQFNLKDNESRLQEQESPLRRGSREFTSGVRCRVNKARVTVSSPGYKEVIGRG